MSEEIKPKQPEAVTDEQLEGVAGGFLDVINTKTTAESAGSGLVSK
jgi:hypothetical protein